MTAQKAREKSAIVAWLTVLTAVFTTTFKIYDELHTNAHDVKSRLVRVEQDVAQIKDWLRPSVAAKQAGLQTQAQTVPAVSAAILETIKR